jgi:hypothetical protein
MLFDVQMRREKSWAGAVPGGQLLGGPPPEKHVFSMLRHA